MLRSVAILVAAALVALLVYGLVAQAPETGIDDALARQEPATAPGFELGVLNDGRPGSLAAVWGRASADGSVRLDELQGTPVVLNIWASWCVPCREEAPVLERGWRRARERGVLFLGINMQDARGDALSFLRANGQTFPNVKDPNDDTARRWGATGIPETFFVSRRGKVVAHVVGTLSDRQLQSGVAAAVAGRPRSPDAGGAQRRTR